MGETVAMNVRGRIARSLALVDAGDELGGLDLLRVLLAELDVAEGNSREIDCPCACGRRFKTDAALDDHLVLAHGGPE
jgi:hypothetical protein